MTSRTKVSSQGRTVIPVEIRERLGIREGEEVEWTLEGDVIKVRLVREEKTPDEIMEYLKNHLVEIKPIRSKAAPTDLKKRMMDEWVKRKLGLTP
ncbi:MAG: AbrB/MazE/SpoVT family DNA-binding domain-containing protein [Nitrososphaerales archaeon]